MGGECLFKQLSMLSTNIWWSISVRLNRKCFPKCSESFKDSQIIILLIFSLGCWGYKAQGIKSTVSQTQKELQECQPVRTFLLQERILKPRDRGQIYSEKNVISHTGHFSYFPNSPITEGAIMIKYQRLGGLYHRNLFLTVVETRNPEIWLG